MKHEKLSQDEKPAFAQPGSNAAATEPGADFTPCPEELARKAYFTYLNEGCPEGRHVQHWLEAEAHLIEVRKRTRIHDFHHRG